MRRARVVAAALLALGCASGGGSRVQRVERDIIRAEEITSRAGDAMNAYQVVEKLRPQMLRGRGVASPTDLTGETAFPKVYVDNVLFGNLAALRNVSSNQIKEIRFISATDATTQWGIGHMAGVIQIVTKLK